MACLAGSPADLLDLYRSRINNHRFDDVAPLIAEDAIFWFNDGSFEGIAAIRSAFEETWQRFPLESYWLDTVAWVARDDRAAACTYHFHWTATVDGRPVSGGGRGTTVMRRDRDGWLIAHEHLSAHPQR
ncbi:Ketosteroid isomerase homolog [Kaistia soli DSM 19436]|uniref:Ketosteroid isomerase homolog n=1 Tax=Kaistia soli DSM 19436 TaxID=1122133 RepID=A0A1M4ZF71_9HYPH|nr:nuclear transport factor 2 family protein [Kaistia soli]SHF16442.1 Ketosteroid isomerase homolog [Kaistia soli DSM 19436]